MEKIREDLPQLRATSTPTPTRSGVAGQAPRSDRRRHGRRLRGRPLPPRAASSSSATPTPGTRCCGASSSDHRGACTMNMGALQSLGLQGQRSRLLEARGGAPRLRLRRREQAGQRRGQGQRGRPQRHPIRRRLLRARRLLRPGSSSTRGTSSVAATPSAFRLQIGRRSDFYTVELHRALLSSTGASCVGGVDLPDPTQEVARLLPRDHGFHEAQPRLRVVRSLHSRSPLIYSWEDVNSRIRGGPVRRHPAIGTGGGRPAGDHSCPSNRFRVRAATYERVQGHGPPSITPDVHHRQPRTIPSTPASRPPLHHAPRVRFAGNGILGGDFNYIPARGLPHPVDRRSSR